MAKRFYPEHLKRRRRRKFLFVLVAVFLLVLGSGFFINYREKSKISWITYHNEELKIALDYPETFSKNTLSEEGKEAGYLLRIFKESPAAIFSLSYVKDLGMVQALGGKNILDFEIAEANRRYPSRFPNYKKIGFSEMILDRERAAQFDFTYTGADGKTQMRQQVVIVVKGDKAFYLSAQAPEGEFEKSEKDFAKIIESFKFID